MRATIDLKFKRVFVVVSLLKVRIDTNGKLVFLVMPGLFSTEERRAKRRWKKRYGRAYFHENAWENERRYPIRDTDKDGINMCLYKNLHNPYSRYNRYFRLLCLDKKRQMRATFLLPTVSIASHLTSYYLSRARKLKKQL